MRRAWLQRGRPLLLYAHRHCESRRLLCGRGSRQSRFAALRAARTPRAADFLRGVAWLHSFWLRRRDRCVSRGAEDRSVLRDGVLGRGDELQSAALVFRGSGQGQGRAGEAWARRRRADREGEDAARAGIPARGRSVVRARRQELLARRRTPQAMAKVAAEHPADDDAQTFYALALLATLPRGDASLPLRQQAGAIAEKVFARNPKHPGAAHYILHAYDHGTLAVEGAAGGAGLREDRAGGEPRAAHARARVPAVGILGRGGRDRRGLVECVDRMGEEARPADREPRLSQPVVAAVRVDAAGTVFQDEGGDCVRGVRLRRREI